MKCPLLSSCLLPVRWHMQSGRETFNLPAKWSGPRQPARPCWLQWCCLGRQLQRVELGALWVGAMSSLHTFTVTTAPSPSTWPSTHNRTFKLLTTVSLRLWLPSSSHCAAAAVAQSSKSRLRLIQGKLDVMCCKGVGVCWGWRVER